MTETDPAPQPTSMQSARLDLARTYLAKLPPAISGDNGHNALYRVACSLVQRFGLPVQDVWLLLVEYNQRCLPRWAKAALVHKLAEAFKTVELYYNEAELSRKLNFNPNAHPLNNGELATAPVITTSGPRSKPDAIGFNPGNEDQLAQLSDLRRVSMTGLCWAQERGLLVFGWQFGFPVYGVRDQSGHVLEVRRLDGDLFPAIGGLSDRKSHAVRGSNKRWPVGIMEAADCPCIALMEGLPDFLAAHDMILREQWDGTPAGTVDCAPVAMLSANPGIDAAALPYFQDKIVRIFPHADASGAGLRGGQKWQQQLLAGGAARVDFFDFSALTQWDAHVKDLNEFLVWINSTTFPADPALHKILPIS